MAKDGTKDLNAVYDEILGKGEPIQDDSVRVTRTDPAYTDEDYSDDAGDGIDPRDKSTESAEEKDVETDEYSEDSDSELSEETEDLEDGEEYDEIPDRLVKAGRNANLADEVIIELAETQPHVLEALAKSQEEAEVVLRKAGQLAGASQQEGLDNSQAEQDSKFKKLELDLGDDEEEFSPAAKKVIGKLVEQVNTLTDTIAQHDKGFGDINRQRRIESTRRIDAFFDEAAKNVPTLGNVKNLTKEQTEARLFAFRIARGAQQTMQGLSDEEALAIGVNALKGQLTEQQVRTKIVSDLNSQKRRFTARPNSRRTASPDKGKTVEERAMAAIDRILDDPKYK